jgi:hypothetical protein
VKFVGILFGVILSFSVRLIVTQVYLVKGLVSLRSSGKRLKVLSSRLVLFFVVWRFFV